MIFLYQMMILQIEVFGILIILWKCHSWT